MCRVLAYTGNDRGCLEQPTTSKSLAKVFQKGLHVILLLGESHHIRSRHHLPVNFPTTAFVKPAIHATETGTSRLVPETCTCVSQSGTRFFWCGIEHSSIPSQKLLGTWHEPCNVIGRSVVIVFVVICYRLFFCCKILWFIYLVILWWSGTMMKLVN